MYIHETILVLDRLEAKGKRYSLKKKKEIFQEISQSKSKKKKEEKATFQEIFQSNEVQRQKKYRFVATIKNAVSATDTRARVVHAQLKRRGPHSADHCSPSGDTPRS